MLEAMNDQTIRNELEALWREEGLPVFAADGLGEQAEAYVITVRERFLNPFLKHRIADIASNHAKKKQRRLIRIIARSKEIGLDLQQLRLKAGVG